MPDVRTGIREPKRIEPTQANVPSKRRLMKDESEIRRVYEKLQRMHDAGFLSEQEQRKMMTLEWVLNDE